MAQPAVATNLNQPLDVGGDFAPQVALDPVLLFERVAQAREEDRMIDLTRAEVDRQPLFDAGIGPARTRVQIWADPTLTRNVHTIRVEADAARFTMTIENVPSEENPKTGKLTALSLLACLRGMVSPLRVGS